MRFQKYLTESPRTWMAKDLLNTLTKDINPRKVQKGLYNTIIKITPMIKKAFPVGRIGEAELRKLFSRTDISKIFFKHKTSIGEVLMCIDTWSGVAVPGDFY